MRRSAQLKTRLFVSAAALSTSSWPTTAAEITVSKLPEDPYALILIEGPIEVGDDWRFAEAVEPYLGAPAMTILRSPGGSAPAALGIGRQIREASFATFVLEGHDCHATCGLIWLAGIQRHLTGASRITVGAEEAQADNQAETPEAFSAELRVYLAALGLPEPAIRYVAEAPARDYRPITPEIARHLGLPVWEVRDGQVVPPDEDLGERNW
jgi:hypothetical protein